MRAKLGKRKIVGQGSAGKGSLGKGSLGKGSLGKGSLGEGSLGEGSLGELGPCQRKQQRLRHQRIDRGHAYQLSQQAKQRICPFWRALHAHELRSIGKTSSGMPQIQDVVDRDWIKYNRSDESSNPVCLQSFRIESRDSASEE
jgi:hypothetical protein